MSKPQDVKDGKRIRIETDDFKNYYIILCYEPDDGEFTVDGAAHEAWITPPDQFQDPARWSDARTIAMLFTSLRKMGMELEDVIERMTETVHPDAMSKSISGIFLGVLKHYGFDEPASQR